MIAYPVPLRLCYSRNMTDQPSLSADIVLEGGGVRGIGLVGALSEIIKKGYSFHQVAGTSAGAIVGSFVAAGCSPEKMLEIMRSLDYKKFQDPTMLSRLGAPGKIASLLIENGLYRGDYLSDWMSEQLANCGVKTFADLRMEPSANLPPEKAYKLIIVTADLSKGELVYLPWDYHKYGLDPDTQTVASAVRMSISIPFFYKPAHLGADTVVDGGLLSNFPVDVFDASSGTAPERPTFGIKLSAREKSNLAVPRRITGPLSLATAVYATAVNGHDTRHLDDPATLARTMFVDSEDIQATNFGITAAQQQSLFQNGQKAAQKFLSTWDFEQYQKHFPH